MQDKIKNILKFTLFFAVGIFIFWWVYRDQDIEKLKQSLSEANYYWLGLSVVLSIFSHLSRAARWNILIKPLGYQPRLINSFFAIMIMYLSNIAIPRSGELTRCGILKKYENVPFSKLLGTVVIDRTFDMIMLLLLLGAVLVTQFPVVEGILENNPEVKQNIIKLLNSTPLIAGVLIGGIGLIILLYLYRKKLSHTIVYKKLSGFTKDVISGIKTVKHMEKKGAFLFHSVFIWVMYFIMIYVSFFAFKFTSSLSILAALTVFVATSFGTVAPSPGGIGTWHFMAIQTLILYGITNTAQLGAFAFAVHGFSTLSLIIFGTLSIILIPIVNRKNESRE